MSLLRRLVVMPFRLWRASFSLVFPSSCRFHPTCSAYAEQAVQQRGLLAGLPLAIWRILRCHPWSRGGYDPVVPSVPPCRPGHSA